MSVDVLDPLARLLAERACERLLVEFVSRLDLGDPAEVAALFTEDGVWEWPAGGRRAGPGRPGSVLRLAARRSAVAAPVHQRPGHRAVAGRGRGDVVLRHLPR
jgi:hypothetical protein